MRSIHIMICTGIFHIYRYRCEIVIVYDKVITLIRTRSDVSHGLIMLATHVATLGAVDPSTYTHRTLVSRFDLPS